MDRALISRRAGNIFLYFLSSGFVLGIIFKALLPGSFCFVASFLFSLSAGIVAYLILERRPAFISGKYFSMNEKIILLAIFIAAFFLGAWRFSSVDADLEKRRSDFLIGGKIKTEGLVIGEPEDRGDKMMFRMRSDKFFYGGDEYDGKKAGLLVFADRFADVRYGDKISIFGSLRRPEPFETDAGREFNYPGYLKKEKILYAVFYPDIEVSERGRGNFLKAWLLSIKKLFLRETRSVMDEPQASLSGGIIWGEKRGLPDDVMENFRRVGLVHIIVLSGYNLSVVADSVIKFFSFLKRRRLRFLLGAVFIVAYATASGGSPAAIRATIMALIVVLAKILGRPYDMARALFLAGAVMSFHNPFVAPYDPGFALSFLATLALIALAPTAKKIFMFVPEKFGARDIISATVATQIFVMPLLFYFSGEFPIFSLPANLFVLPLVPLAMFASFVSSAVAILSDALAWPVAFVADIILAYFIKVAEFLGALSFATLPLKNFPLWGTAVLYTCIAFVMWLGKSKRWRLFR